MRVDAVLLKTLFRFALKPLDELTFRIVRQGIKDCTLYQRELAPYIKQYIGASDYFIDLVSRILYEIRDVARHDKNVY